MLANVHPARFCLVFTNVIFLFFGLAMVGAGLFLVAGITADEALDKTSSKDFNPTAAQRHIGLFFLYVGFTCFISAILGCLGGFFNVRIILGIYLALLVLFLVTGCATVSFLSSKDGTNKTFVQQGLENMVRNYNEVIDRDYLAPYSEEFQTHSPEGAQLKKKVQEDNSTVRVVFHMLKCCGILSPYEFLDGSVPWIRDPQLTKSRENESNRTCRSVGLPIACCKTRFPICRKDQPCCPCAIYFTKPCGPAAAKLLASVRDFLVLLFVIVTCLELLMIFIAGKQFLKENLEFVFEQTHVRQLPRSIILRSCKERSAKGGGDTMWRSASKPVLALTPVQAKSAPQSPHRPKGITTIIKKDKAARSNFKKTRQTKEGMGVIYVDIDDSGKSSFQSSAPSTSDPGWVPPWKRTFTESPVGTEDEDEFPVEIERPPMGCSSDTIPLRSSSAHSFMLLKYITPEEHSLDVEDSTTFYSTFYDAEFAGKGEGGRK